MNIRTNQDLGEAKLSPISYSSDTIQRPVAYAKTLPPRGAVLGEGCAYVSAKFSAHPIVANQIAVRYNQGAEITIVGKCRTELAKPDRIRALIIGWIAAERQAKMVSRCLA